MYFQMYMLDLEKAKETDQIANIRWMIEKARKLKKKKVYFCFIDYGKAFVWITANWKILKEMGIPDHLTCLLRNLYVGPEATVTTLTWNNRVVQNWERSTSRLYIVILLL